MNLLDLVFPKRCFGCGRLGVYVCSRCQGSVRVLGSHETICPVCQAPARDGATHRQCRGEYTPDGLTSFFRYSGVVRKMIKAMKYRSVRVGVEEIMSFVPLTSHTILYKIRKQYNFICIPIPLHASKERIRGFNQAWLIGDIFSRHLQVPLVDGMVRRVVKTTPQVEVQDRSSRLINMQGVFEANIKQLSNRSIKAVFLVDDVFTTGATIRSAVNVLKRAGVKFVWAMTLAR